MKKALFTIIILSSLFYVACKDNKQENPLLNLQEDLQKEHIPFDKIKISDYEPAFKEAVKRHNKEIEEIINDRHKPTFDNTVAALDYSGRLLSQITLIFDNTVKNNSDEELTEIRQRINLVLFSHSTDIMMNAKLFDRIKTVWDNRSKFNLDEQQQYLLKKTYTSFVRNGALLDKEKQNELKKINLEIASLTDKYTSNEVAETKNYKLVISDSADLKGLPEWFVREAFAKAKQMNNDGKCIVTSDYKTVMTFLTYAQNRKLRQQIYEAFVKKGNNANQYDNSKTAEQILHLRAKVSEILGYKDFASWQTEDITVKTVHNADSILRNCLKYSLASADMDIKQYQYLLSLDEKGAVLEGWDVYYYAQKVKRQRYAYDAQQLREYFELNNVLQGCFADIKRLYGLSFEKADNISTYASDVTVYQVIDEDKNNVGLLYFDPYARKGKKGGAWCSVLSPQYKKDGKRINPVVQVCSDYVKNQNRTTLTVKEVKSLFYQMGQAVAEFLSDAVYPSLSSNNVQYDFALLPSLLQEQRALLPEVLKTYAYDSNGEAMDGTLVQRLRYGENSNQGFTVSSLLLSAWTDIRLHSLMAEDTLSVQMLRQKALKELKIPFSDGLFFANAGFDRIFGQVYPSLQFCYGWNCILSSDAFQAWRETGDVFNVRISNKFKDYILSHGGCGEGLHQYRLFRGKDPDAGYFLSQKGLLFSDNAKEGKEDEKEED